MQPDQLSLTFAALADPTRRSIVTRLADGEATVNELAEPFPPEGGGHAEAGSSAAFDKLAAVVAR